MVEVYHDAAIELEARPGEIIIRAASNPRAGWREKIEKLLAAHGDPANEFEQWGISADEGLKDIPWDGPTYEEWVGRDDH